MKRITKALLAAGITAGAVFGGASAAMADSYQSIAALQSPNGYGQLTTNIDWHNDVYFTFASGSLKDLADDGHGPYLHVVAVSNGIIDGKFSACDIHNTNGYNTSVSVTNCAGIETNGPLDSIHVWVCNGGNAAGSGTVEGGCYGRQYYNQVRFPGKASQSLGTSSVPV